MMPKALDSYTTIFKELAKRGEQAVPFQILTHIEIKSISHDGVAKAILFFEDLVTGETKTTESQIKMGGRRVVFNPFTRKGPYFLNSVENVVRKFRKENGVEE